MRTMFTIIRFGSIAVLAALVLAACGGATPTSVPPTSVPPTSVAPTPVVAVSAAPTALAPTIEVPTSTAVLTTDQPTAVVPTTAAASGEVVALPTKLNLNEVTGDQLLSMIPDFSNRMVREFQEYRPYRSISQFRQEIGKYVDEATVAGYEQYVYVPIDINQADVATLQQIPGIDAALAESLIASRPFASNEAFLEKLAASLSESQLAAAAYYLVK
jgi:radical SAM superfamily enzyme with C-terminal helix-hairpin-helix motif